MKIPESTARILESANRRADYGFIVAEQIHGTRSNLAIHREPTHGL